MNAYKITIILLTLFMVGGCQTGQLDITGVKGGSVGCFYPDSIRFVGLTGFSVQLNAYPTITAYVDMLDAFGSRIKSPAEFRFELFEYAIRSAEPRGKRIYIWPGLKLNRPAVNNDYWQDYLRTYKFELVLDFYPSAPADYILTATCLTQNGKRISDSIKIELEEF